MTLENAPGTLVRYVPLHAHGDADHPDCEDGVVTSVRGAVVFVRFDKQPSDARGQACNPEMLVPRP